MHLRFVLVVVIFFWWFLVVLLSFSLLLSVYLSACPGAGQAVAPNRCRPVSHVGESVGSPELFDPPAFFLGDWQGKSRL